MRVRPCTREMGVQKNQLSRREFPIKTVIIEKDLLKNVAQSQIDRSTSECLYDENSTIRVFNQNQYRYSIQSKISIPARRSPKVEKKALEISKFLFNNLPLVPQEELEQREFYKTKSHFCQNKIPEQEFVRNFDKLKQAQELKERKIQAGRKKDKEG